MKCSEAGEPYFLLHSSSDCQPTNPTTHRNVTLAELEGHMNRYTLFPSADVYKDHSEDGTYGMTDLSSSDPVENESTGIEGKIIMVS